jgi:hypothetical protein
LNLDVFAAAIGVVGGLGRMAAPLSAQRGGGTHLPVYASLVVLFVIGIVVLTIRVISEVHESRQRQPPEVLK